MGVRLKQELLCRKMLPEDLCIDLGYERKTWTIGEERYQIKKDWKYVVTE